PLRAGGRGHLPWRADPRSALGRPSGAGSWSLSRTVAGPVHVRVGHPSGGRCDRPSGHERSPRDPARLETQQIMIARLSGALRRIALVFTLAVLSACGGPDAQLPRLAPDDVVLAFGDSLTFGTGARE